MFEEYGWNIVVGEDGVAVIVAVMVIKFRDDNSPSSISSGHTSLVGCLSMDLLKLELEHTSSSLFRHVITHYVAIYGQYIIAARVSLYGHSPRLIHEARTDAHTWEKKRARREKNDRTCETCTSTDDRSSHHQQQTAIRAAATTMKTIPMIGWNLSLWWLKWNEEQKEDEVSEQRRKKWCICMTGN